MAKDGWLKILAVAVGAILVFLFLDDGFDPESVRGKRVLITGSSTGIGEQLAYQYAKLGAHVVVTARRQHVLQQVVRRCQDYGGKGSIFGYVTADMSNVTSADYVIKETVKQLGGLDVIVLNHIKAIPLQPWSGSPQDLTILHQVLDVNLRSYIHLASAALPWLRQSSGSIIVMSSLAGKVGIPLVAAYSATKFALNGFFSALRNELTLEGTHDISITICTLGLIGTENALNHLRDHSKNKVLDNVSPEDPADTAKAILRGGALRQRDVFYPYASMKAISLMRDWVPNIVDKIINHASSRPSPDKQSS